MFAFAAVNGIAEGPLQGVSADEIEEHRGADDESERDILLHLSQDFVLLARIQLRKRGDLRLLHVRIHVHGRQPHGVVVSIYRQGPGQRAIDVLRRPGFLGAWAVFIRRDQSRADGVKRGEFRAREYHWRGDGNAPLRPLTGKQRSSNGEDTAEFREHDNRRTRKTQLLQKIPARERH